MTVRTYLYDANGNDREVPLDKSTISNLDRDQLLWVDIRGEDEAEIREVASLFGLSKEAVRDLIEKHERPDLENYGDYFHLRVIGVSDIEGLYVPVHLDMVAGRDYVMTLERENTRLLQGFNDQIRGDSKVGQLAASDFVASLLDLHLDSYFRALEGLEEELDKFDERVLRRRSSNIRRHGDPLLMQWGGNAPLSFLVKS